MRDHYAVLGIARDADPDVVRAAYRALAKKYHPDAAVTGNAETATRFREISDAYSVLSRAEQRGFSGDSAGRGRRGKEAAGCSAAERPAGLGAGMRQPYLRGKAAHR